MAALGRWRTPVLVAGGMLSVLAGGSGMSPNPPLPPLPTAPDHLPPKPTASVPSPPYPAPLDRGAVPPAPGVVPVTAGNRPPVEIPVAPDRFTAAIPPVALPTHEFGLSTSPKPVSDTIPPPNMSVGPPLHPLPDPVAPVPRPPAVVPVVTPDLPAPSAFVNPPAQKPHVPQPPAEPEITEPVATVHRFAGTYLGGDERRLLVYAETGDGKAEVQSRPIAHLIPKADADGKDDVTRVAISAGRVARHDRLAFVTAARELVAIGTNENIEWRFTLPGKPDNGERLLDVAGFHDGQVFVASQQAARPGKEEALGRVYSLEIDTGRLVAFAIVNGGFDADARLTLDGPNGTLFSLGKARVIAHGLVPHLGRWEGKVPALPITHAFGTDMTVCVTTPKGLSIVPCAPVDSNRIPVQSFLQPMLIEGVTGTAPVAMRVDNSRLQARIYAPVKSVAGHFALAAIDSWNATPAWQVRVPKAFTASPVLHRSSIYFDAGSVLYRVNAGTGAVCWKHTIPLTPSETLTDLAFIRGEIRASGPGVFVRVAERPEPVTAPPSAPANPVPGAGVTHPPDPSP